MFPFVASNKIKLIYACPSSPKDCCKWEGDAIEILEHFQQAHREFLLDSNVFPINVSRSSEQNWIMPSERGLFLLQIKVLNINMKLQIQLRFLAYEQVNVEAIRYAMEISYGIFGFTNENSHEEYNPVYNANKSVEVDVKAIELIVGHNIQHLILKLNILDDLEVPLNLINTEMENSDDDNNLNSSSEVVAGDIYQDCVDFNIFEDVDVSEGIQNVHVFETEPRDVKESYETDEIIDHNFSIDTIQCTNCQRNMIPPIHVCPDGHNVCYTCRYINCKICNQVITKFRNINLEEFSKTIIHPCRYEVQGCTKVCDYSEIRKHELNCCFCIYKCQICVFEGKLSDIGTHFRIAHPSTKIYETMSGIHFPKGSNFIIWNSLGVFYCSSSATDIYIEWKVIYCGPKERFFSCDVEVSGKKTNQPVKHFFLKRYENVFKSSVTWDELKSANVKEKYATLQISSY